MVGLDGSPLYRRRVCDTFSYPLSPGPDGEQALYDATTAYLRDTYDRALDNRPAARLAMGVFQRRLASSTLAVLRSFERRTAKIERTIDDLRSGRVTASELRSRQRRLDRENRDDFFDTHGADDDARDVGGGERHEDYEEALLGAVVAVTIEELQSEVHVLAGLGERARRLVASGRESKFEALREVLEDPRHDGEKWLVFTEHRDTAGYLVRRLEGFGYSGHVAQIHGGLAWPAREAEVEHFRRPDGARFLVATDAAGEGINLQFCRLMVNYDVPWNPARLEQRMGRIHRYGQRHDVQVVNLVAGSTHEGRVLRVLLDKLDVIRRELRSDKVFDVIGRLFENRSLREHMVEALTDEGERRVIDHVTSKLTARRVEGVADQDARVYGQPSEVATRLGGLRVEMERERYLQLLPGYVRRFVQKAASLLGLQIRGDLDALFSLAPGRGGALDALLPALEDHPPAARERLCVRRPAADETCVWLHPGEPVFDVLMDQVRRTYAREGVRGGIFTDPKADAPYLFHLGLASVEEDRGGAGGMDPNATAGSTADSGGGQAGGAWRRDAHLTGAPTASPVEPRTLERRLFGLRQEADGALSEVPVEHLLLLHGAPAVAPGAVPLASRGVAMRAAAAEYAERKVAARIVEERRAALRADLPERLRRIRIGFDLRAAELAGRRSRLAVRGVGSGGTGGAGEADGAADGNLDAVKQEQRALPVERRLALARTDTAPEGIVPGAVRFSPTPGRSRGDAGELERYDARVEEIAVRIAAGWERERGSNVRDVSTPAAARLAGLPDWPGFDLLATPLGGAERSIEVKGRAGRSAIQLEPNEWKQACHLEDRYWLYVVLDCATPDPLLVRVRDPFRRLLAKSRESSMWLVSFRSLMDAAEPA